MCKVKDSILDMETAVEIFGNFQDHYVINTDVDNLEAGDTVTLVNSNCEFSFDNVVGEFEDNLYYYYVVDLELVSMDLSCYNSKTCNNGGGYGFAECRVLKVYEKTY